MEGTSLLFLRLKRGGHGTALEGELRTGVAATEEPTEGRSAPNPSSPKETGLPSIHPSTVLILYSFSIHPFTSSTSIHHPPNCPFIIQLSTSQSIPPPTQPSTAHLVIHPQVCKPPSLTPHPAPHSQVGWCCLGSALLSWMSSRLATTPVSLSASRPSRSCTLSPRLCLSSSRWVGAVFSSVVERSQHLA